MVTKLKLVPRTEAQRQAALDQVYRQVLHAQRKVPPTGNVFSISSVANLPSDEEVGQPIDDYNIYAELPDTIASDPNVINRINRAGEFFIQQNKCPPLNRSIRHFKQKIRSVEDLERLTDTIAATLKCIVLTSLGGLSQVLCTNTDDLKTMLLGTLNGLANSSSLSDKFEQEWHSPLVSLAYD
uniref:Uncharacterized protein n=1 Tax=Panagrolaimus sp. ES5 TaxID=591445 RepID=A0AC34FBY8_9BILA